VTKPKEEPAEIGFITSFSYDDGPPFFAGRGGTLHVSTSAKVTEMIADAHNHSKYVISPRVRARSWEILSPVRSITTLPRAI